MPHEGLKDKKMSTTFLPPGYINAAEELTRAALRLQITIEAAEIKLGEDSHVLYSDHTPAEYEAFLKGLDRVYNAGYGSQRLFGHVWLSDGSWLERHEYDGAESWRHHRLPKMPTRPAGATAATSGRLSMSLGALLSFE